MSLLLSSTRAAYRGSDQAESVWRAAEVVRCGMYWKVEVTGFTERLDAGYEVRSQGCVQVLVPSSWKDGASSNGKMIRLGVRGDQSFALAELSLTCPLNFHGKVVKEAAGHTSMALREEDGAGNDSFWHHQR